MTVLTHVTTGAPVAHGEVLTRRSTQKPYVFLRWEEDGNGSGHVVCHEVGQRELERVRAHGFNLKKGEQQA